jgi:circadian clock protein KaiC
MTWSTAQPERVPTGIAGLDRVLEGGLLRGGVYIVAGPPGCGKTILGNQVCFHHAASGKKCVFLTLLAESHARMFTHLQRMTFFDEALIADNIHYLSAFKVLEEQGLEALFTVLRKTVEAERPTVLVIDGLTSVDESAWREYKKLIHELQVVTAMTGCTAILLSSSERRLPFRPEHTMVDGIIEITVQVQKLQLLRHLEVRKLRGAKQIGGEHTLDISDEGVTVWPRFESELTADADPPVPDSGRMPIGIPDFDKMLCGGLPKNSVTTVLGPSGSGKTILGLQFLVEGARNGQPGLLFGFYERPKTLLAKSKRIGLALEQAVAADQIQLMWRRPVEGVIDMIGHQLLSEVRRRGVQRLFIDGMQGFQVAVDSPDRIRDVFSTLADALEREGVTTIYSMETADLFGPRIEVPVSGTSQTTHNIILLRHVELNASLYRLISILKVRESDYDPAIREFKITDDGLVVSNAFTRAEQILSGLAHGPKPNKLRSLLHRASSMARRGASNGS